MMFLKTLTWFLLLQCYIIATLYQLSTCLAEEQSGHTTTGIPKSNSEHSETIPSPAQQCTHSINGVPGIPGIPGSPGPMGPPGVKGQHGQIGSKGVKGDLGPDGQPGQNGVPGSPGPRGEKGDTGQKGEGQIGQKGVQGQPGPQGDKGEPGLKGSTGGHGLTGPKGQPGLQGHKGDKGQPGETQQTNRIAFSVSRTTTLGLVSQNTPVTYQKIYTNMGNGFNIGTGKFTCSVSGVYFFMISALRKNDQSLFMCLMKNDEELPCIYVVHSANRYHGSASNSVIIDLQHGDEVWVKLASGYALYSNGSEYTTFTGYLLYENA